MIEEERNHARPDSISAGRIAIEIGARLRRYHPDPENAVSPPALFRQLLDQLERAERRA